MGEGAPQLLDQSILPAGHLPQPLPDVFIHDSWSGNIIRLQFAILAAYDTMCLVPSL